jgi:hypothetical protein
VTIKKILKFHSQTELEQEKSMANIQTLINILAVIAARIASKNNQKK